MKEEIKIIDKNDKSIKEYELKNKLNIEDLGSIGDKIEDLIKSSKGNTGFEDKMPYSVGKFLERVGRGEVDKELQEDIEFARKIMDGVDFKN